LFIYSITSQSLLPIETVEGFSKAINILIYGFNYISLVSTIVTGVTLITKAFIAVIETFIDILLGKG